MKKVQQDNKGFSLVEVLLAAALVGLLVTAIAGAIVYGQQSQANAGARQRAVLLAEECQEASRSIRDNNFSALTAGSHGLRINNNNWEFFNTSDTLDSFTREAVVNILDADRVELSCNVSWGGNSPMGGSISLASYLTNWQDTAGVTPPGNAADSLFIDISGATANAKQLNGITIENTGTGDITIDIITVSWIGGANGNNVQEILINSGSVWAGNAPTGQDLDITDYVLAGGATEPIDFLFKKNIGSATVDLIFTMSDTSIKTVTGISL